MNNPFAKSAALAAIILWGSLASSLAHAAILRSSDGMPILTKDGACVTTGWEGGEDCEAAKAASRGDDNGATYEERNREKTVYFDFNKSTLTAHARHHLDHLARKLLEASKHHHQEPLTIVGFADRLGNATYNQKLAMRRAQAVRAYLVAKGVKTRKISVRSLGKTEPMAECAADLPRSQLISCLREDRRVEIEIGPLK